MVRRQTQGLLFFAILLIFLAGCSSKTMVESDLHIKGAPDWVNEGTQMLKDKNGRLFHGVGSATPMGDESLQKSTADDRARAELARILNSYLTVASNDYSTSASSGGEVVHEQSVTREIENLSRVNLTGSKIIGRWRDKKSGDIYSIAELDMKHMKQTLELAEQMSPSLRAFLNQESDNIFDRLAGDKP